MNTKNRLFDELPDESPPSVGEEVGQALAGAIGELGKSNEAMGRMLALAIQDALKKPEIVPVIAERPVVTGWKFKVVRDKSGNMDTILATATFAGRGVDG